jgi:putative colanic acid biosynthesis acetyltransferase WcaF
LDQLTIGSNVVISQGAMIIQGSHDYKKIDYPTYTKPVVLEDGSWVGAGAIVTLGVTMKSHSVLAAGSMASKDLEAYTVYQGNPAVMVRERVIYGN